MFSLCCVVQGWLALPITARGWRGQGLLIFFAFVRSVFGLVHTPHVSRQARLRSFTFSPPLRSLGTSG